MTTVSVLLKIAKAIVAELDSALGITAPLDFTPALALEKLDTQLAPQAWTRPAGLAPGDLGADQVATTYTVQIILVTLAGDPNVTGGALEKAEQIVRHFGCQRLAGYERAICEATAVDTPADPDRWRELHLHVVQVELRYGVIE